jgi:cell division protein FtsZ
MASPLLEDGAIDGARGILINITGSSALRLSEVNAASSLIQEAAHEDANIIFGAVLDERMGDEVKITVIATGFREQMPARRAFMLTVQEAPVISVPILPADNWLREPVKAVSAELAPAAHLEPVEPEPAVPAAAIEERAPAPPPAPRFMSEVEEMEESGETVEEEEPTLAAATAAVSARTVEDEIAAFDQLFADSGIPARPRFAELSEESPYKPLPRDYAADLGNGVRPPAPTDEPRPRSIGELFSDKPEELERELEVPAFMRRSPF